MVEEQRFQVSTNPHTSQAMLQRLPVALGGGMGAQLSTLFICRVAEAKPEDTCAYSRGWSANTHS